MMERDIQAILNSLTLLVDSTKGAVPVILLQSHGCIFFLSYPAKGVERL
jgi:hypothetical protein